MISILLEIKCTFRELLMEVEPCSHPTIMNDMCAECGADLRKDELMGTASIPMVHAIPDLKVSEEVSTICLIVLNIFNDISSK